MGSCEWRCGCRCRARVIRRLPMGGIGRGRGMECRGRGLVWGMARARAGGLILGWGRGRVARWCGRMR